MRLKLKCCLALLVMVMALIVIPSCAFCGGGDPSPAGRPGMLSEVTMTIQTQNITATIITQSENGTDWMAIIVSVSQNPPILAAFMTLIWNVGGYIATCAHNKKLEPYDKSKLLETLAIFEAVILAMQGLAGLPSQFAASLGLILNFIWSFKKAISDFTQTLRSQKVETATPPTPRT